MQKTGGMELKQDLWSGLLPAVSENQMKDLEREEKDTDLHAGRVSILGRFLSFVLNLQQMKLMLWFTTFCLLETEQAEMSVFAFLFCSATTFSLDWKPSKC